MMLIMNRPMASYSIVLAMAVLALPSSYYLLQILEHWSCHLNCLALRPCQSHCFHCFDVDYRNLKFQNRKCSKLWANQRESQYNRILNRFILNLQAICSSEANDCSTGSSKFGSIFIIDLSFIVFMDAINGFIDGMPGFLFSENFVHFLRKPKFCRLFLAIFLAMHT